MSVLERCLSYRESNKGIKKAGTNSKCPFYRGVPLTEVSVKRESTVLRSTPLAVDKRCSLSLRHVVIFFSF